MMKNFELNIGPPDPDMYPDATFYYSREKRHETAPDKKSRANEPPSRKGGYFRSLTDTAPKLMLFITIAALCVIIAVLRYAL